MHHFFFYQYHPFNWNSTKFQSKLIFMKNIILKKQANHFHIFQLYQINAVICSYPIVQVICIYNIISQPNIPAH